MLPLLLLYSIDVAVWFSNVRKLLRERYHTQYIVLGLVYALIFSQ